MMSPAQRDVEDLVLAMPPRCIQSLQDGSGQCQEWGHEVLGLVLCHRHERRLRDAIQAEADRRLDSVVHERREARRLESIHGHVAKHGSSWRYRYGLPSDDGGRRGRQITRSGFATKYLAQRALAAALEDLRSGPVARLRIIDEAERAELEARRERMRQAEDRVRVAAATDRVQRARERREAQRARFVYYVQRPDGCIKIGTTWSITTRMQAFRNVAPVELLAVHSGGQPAEAALHRRFAQHRRDGEWFDPAQVLLTHIDHVVSRARGRGV